MRFGSLFAGIGGFDLGLERAGMECAWQVEIDDFCRKVLAKHWPDVERFEDVINCGKHNLQPVELVCGGFPCQPHSLAGKRKGAKDDRDLWPEMRRIIAELRPRWVFAENVPGIRTTILDQVLSDLEDMDYTTGTLVVPACAVNAPHRRDRVWIVAYSGKPRRQQIATGAHGDESKNEGWRQKEMYQFAGDGQGCRGGYVSDSDRSEQGRRKQQERKTHSGNPQPARNGKEGTVANANITRLQEFTRRQFESIQGAHETKQRCSTRGTPPEREQWGWWSVEPDVGRVANGVPRRVDRLRALGNAVVPQVVELIGRSILDADSEEKRG